MTMNVVVLKNQCFEGRACWIKVRNEGRRGLDI